MPVAGLLLASMLPATSLALGFGREHGDQQVGRPFYAEIPVYSAEKLRADCVRVRPLDGDASTFVGPLSITVEGQANARRITLSGVQPLRVPFVTFVLETTCDGMFSKEFTFLADPPGGAPRNTTKAATTTPVQIASPGVGGTGVSAGAELSVPTGAPTALAVAPAGGSPPQGGGGGEYQQVPVSTTLNAIARQYYPDDREARDRFRAAIARANPDIFPQQGPVGSIVIAAGTRIRIPESVPWPTRPPKLSAPVARSDVPAKPKEDRLTLNRTAGGKLDRATSAKLDALGEALANLEGGMAERDRVQGELVTAAGQTVQSIMEIRKAQEAQIQNLERVSRSLAETIAAMEKDRADRITLADLALLLGALAVVACVLVWLHHRLAMQRLGTGSQALLATGAPTLGVFQATLNAEHHADAIDTASVASPVVNAEVAPVESTAPASVVAPATVNPSASSLLPGMTAPELHAAPQPADVTASTPSKPARTAGPDTIEFERPAPVAAKPAEAAPAVDFADVQPGSAIIELADLMIAMGMPKNGVVSLIQHLDETRSTDPVEWMKLMTTARALKLDEDELVKPKIREFLTRFNIRLDNQDTRTTIESFPHVMRMICAAWSKGTAVDDLHALLQDDRQGERAGFPEAVAAELIFLLLIAKERFASAV